jgi:hypothetical protein
MQCKTQNNKLAVITKGKYKDSFCIILGKSRYLNNDKLIWYTVYKDNIVFKISYNSVSIL